MAQNKLEKYAVICEKQEEKCDFDSKKEGCPHLLFR